MNSAPGYFTEGGQATRCMQSLGTTLVKKGVAMSSQFTGHPAMDRFAGRMPAGLEHLPGQVDSALHSYGADSIAMDQEFLWLSKVLPPLPRGTPRPTIRLELQLARWCAGSGQSMKYIAKRTRGPAS